MTRGKSSCGYFSCLQTPGGDQVSGHLNLLPSGVTLTSQSGSKSGMSSNYPPNVGVSCFQPVMSVRSLRGCRAASS